MKTKQTSESVDIDYIMSEMPKSNYYYSIDQTNATW